MLKGSGGSMGYTAESQNMHYTAANDPRLKADGPMKRFFQPVTKEQQHIARMENVRLSRQNWRDHLPMDEKWLADAMWREDGTPATMREIMSSDPYLRQYAVEEMIQEKGGHPLQHGIRQALRRRQEVQLQKENEEDCVVNDMGMTQRISEVNNDVPLSHIQRQVYDMINKKNKDKFGSAWKKVVPGYYDGISQDNQSRKEFDEYLLHKKILDPEVQKRMNIAGVDHSLDKSDVWSMSMTVLMYVCFACIILFSIEPWLMEVGLHSNCAPREDPALGF